MKIKLVGVELFYVEERADRMEVTVVFSYCLPKAPMCGN